MPGLLGAMDIDKPAERYCKACFDGCYAVEFDEHLSKNCLEVDIV